MTIIPSIYSSGFSFGYNNNKLFDKAKLDIKPGDRIQLVGNNGCGKTTLLRLMAGSLKPDLGNIVVNGDCYHVLGAMGGFFPFFTLKQNLTLLKYRLEYFSTNSLTEVYDEFLRFSMLSSDKLNLTMENLSAGEKLRLAFFGLVFSSSEIYMFDEFIGGVDEQFLAKRSDLIDNKILCADILIIASHNVEFAKRYKCIIKHLNDIIQ
tara:strand:+ start:13723 stop:14343 length:621 start_codon:yes stop_codon:yes gene_type:complete